MQGTPIPGEHWIEVHPCTAVSSTFVSLLSFESRQVDLGEPTVLTRALIDFETAYVHIGRSTT
jgi:hypothetical protein